MDCIEAFKGICLREISSAPHYVFIDRHDLEVFPGSFEFFLDAIQLVSRYHTETALSGESGSGFRVGEYTGRYDVCSRGSVARDFRSGFFDE